MVGSAQLERIEVLVVTMLQPACEGMAGSALLERIKVIAVTTLQVSRQRSSSFRSSPGQARPCTSRR